MTAEQSEVILRIVALEDLPTLFAHQADPIATELAAFPSRLYDAFMAHWAKILSDSTVIARTIVADGEVVGNVVGFENLGRREIGYWIGREFWGRGIATAAVRQFLLIETKRPLEAAVVEHNTASMRVVTSCGFTAYGQDDDYVLYRLEQ
jgi:RimJ/RimL family protein N-acetyltransferase